MVRLTDISALMRRAFRAGWAVGLGRIDRAEALRVLLSAAVDLGLDPDDPEHIHRLTLQITAGVTYAGFDDDGKTAARQMGVKP